MKGLYWRVTWFINGSPAKTDIFGVGRECHEKVLWADSGYNYSDAETYAMAIVENKASLTGELTDVEIVALMDGVVICRNQYYCKEPVLLDSAD